MVVKFKSEKDCNGKTSEDTSRGVLSVCCVNNLAIIVVYKR